MGEIGMVEVLFADKRAVSYVIEFVASSNLSLTYRTNETINMENVVPCSAYHIIW